MKTKTKVILAITLITVIMSIFCISCFASVDSIEVNKKYTIDNAKYANVSLTARAVYNTTGKVYDGEELIGSFTTIKIEVDRDITWSKFIFLNNNVEIYNVTSPDNDVIIIFDTVDNTSTTGYTSTKYFLNKAPADKYENTYDLLSFVNNTINTIVSYITTNTITLICICIVIVSLGVGFLIRIMRVN